MIEPVDKNGKVRVYYNVLEADREGEIPSFDSESKTALQLIAYLGNMVSIFNRTCKRCELLAKCKIKNPFFG